MSEPYKEPETVRTASPKEEVSKEPFVVEQTAESKPVLVESHDKPVNLPTQVSKDPFLGATLNGRYRVLSLIGKGATSAVYRVEDTKLNQSVAIKVLRSHLAEDPVIMRRFEQEAKTAQLLRHPNIVDVRGYEKTDSGNPFLVMDLVEGTSLQDAIKASGWLPPERSMEIFVQVCAALAAAHEKGIVHRDLKPSNIMLTQTPDGNLLVKVLDFGVAKILPATGDTVLRLTQNGEMLGSILYMSPEQCLDKELDGRSDCYSLGCVMYETLTGKPPLTARTAFETMNKHMTEMPERLDRIRPDLKWSEGLQYIVFKAMAKDPNLRYRKIVELQDDLQKLLAERTIAFDQAKQRKTDQIAAAPAKEKRFWKNLKPVLVLPLMFATVLVAAYMFLGLLTAAMMLLGTVAGSAGVFVSLAAFACVLFAIELKRRSIWLPPDRKVPSQPVVSLAGASSSLPISIAAMELDCNSERPIRYWVSIQPDSNQQIRLLKIEPVDGNHRVWTGIARNNYVVDERAFPIPAEVYLDTQNEPIAVVIRGALALVVK